MRLKDEALALAFRYGEDWAYIELDRRFRKPILRYAFQRFNNLEVAEEVTQEILLKAYRFRETYDPACGLSTWLWTIARNSIIDLHRKCGSEPGTSREVPAPSVEDLETDTPSAEAITFFRSKKKELFTLLKKLTRLQRKVIWFRLVHQLSYHEIAAKLGISLSAAKCAAYRARLILVPLVTGASILN